MRGRVMKLRHEPSSNAPRSAVPAILGAIVFTLSLVAMYGPSLVEHVRRSADPFCFNDDARQHIFPFYRYQDSNLFRDDYHSDYLLALAPLGHSLVYMLSARFWDPAWVSKALPYLQYALLLLAVAAAALRLGRWPASWATLALVLSSDLFLDRMVGGAARSWAFPLVGLATAALVHGKGRFLAALVPISALFYPPACVIVGFCLALVLFVLPARDRGDASELSRGRRVITLFAAATISLALMLPTLSNLAPFGPRLGPENVAEYPEAGTGGRYGFRDQMTSPPFLMALADTYGLAFQSQQEAWIPSLRSWIYGGHRYGIPTHAPFVAAVVVFAILIGLGGFRLAQRSPAARRLTCLLLSGCVGYVSATLFAPYLMWPQRYLVYTVPVFVVVALPSAAGALFAFRFRGRCLRSVGVLTVTALCLILLGGRGGGDAGLNIHIDQYRKLYERIATLPEDVVIAGWPTGVVQNVPYLCRRKVLITREIHHAHHTGVADEMRRRMRALVDAYFAVEGDPSPLVRLRDEMGVTHLVVDLSHYSSRFPAYFEPFNEWIEPAHSRIAADGSLVAELAGDSAVYREGPIVLIALSEL